MKHQKNRGFSLAEVLIALTLLGVIAAFTIPKLITSSANNNNRAVLRDDVNVVADIINTAVNNSQVTEYSSDTSIINALTRSINSLRTCNPETAGNCSITLNVGSTPYTDTNMASVIFSNDSTIHGFIRDPSIANVVYFIIDANGTKTPNQLGQDQLKVLLCLAPNEGTCPNISPTSPDANRDFGSYGPCGLNCGPNNGSTTNDSANEALWNSIIQSSK